MTIVAPCNGLVALWLHQYSTGTDVEKFVFQCSPGESNLVDVTALNTIEPRHVISNNVAF